MTRLTAIERVQLGAAAIVGVSVLLPWYGTNPGNANVDGHRGDVTAWAAHPSLRWVLLAGVAAALWSGWQTLRGDTPTRGFHRGETSAVVATVVVALVLIQGFVDRPGEPSGAIDLTHGWFLALAAALVALAAAVKRLPAPARKPPGA